MNATLNTPEGRVRTRTQRRFVLLLSVRGNTPVVTKRSDSVETLRAHARRLYVGMHDRRTRIFDTVTGEEVVR